MRTIARTGRPKTDNPRNERLLTRLSAEEKQMLEYCCDKTGRTKTDIVVEGIRKVYEEITRSTRK